MRIGLYPGTFDPIHFGHHALIERGVALVDKFYIGIAENPLKKPFLPLDIRLALIEEEVLHFPQDLRHKVSVTAFKGTLVQCAQNLKASVIFRGLRAVTDVAYECQMTAMNKVLDAHLETVFLLATDPYQFISSKLVREVCAVGGNVEMFVSQRVAKVCREYVITS